MTAPATVIIDQLDTWSSAIKTKSSAGRGGGKNEESYGIKKLRELILEMAVRGLLVPQDPDDDPASASLKKIEYVKSRLIKQGKLKKQKKLAEIGNDEMPFSIPSGWEWVRLGNVTNYGVCDKAEASNVDDRTWVLELEDVEKSTSKLLQKVRFAERNFRSSKNRFGKSDVIYGKLRPYLDKVLIADEPGVCTTEMIPVSAYAAIAPEFLRLALKSPYFIRYANESTHGMNLPRLGTDKARAGLIPLPPEPEQYRIVAKVHELMSLCDQLEQQQEDSARTHGILVQALLGALTSASERGQFVHAWQRIASHFDTLFTAPSSIDQLEQVIRRLAIMGKLVPQDPSDELATELLSRFWLRKRMRLTEGYPNSSEAKTQLSKHSKQTLPVELPALPETWTWSTLLSASLLVVDCHNKTAPYTADGIRLLRTTNIRNGALNFDEPKFISSETFERWSARCKPESGDILITREAPMGETCLIPENLTVCMGQRMMLVRLDPEYMSNRYVLLTIMSPDLMSRVQDKPVGATVQHLRVGGVETLLVPVPPIAEQHRIVAKVDELMTICERLKASIRAAQAAQLDLADSLIEAAIH